MPTISRRAFLVAPAVALAACRPSSPTHYDCDVCIVGSGFAGLYLAQRLVHHGARVILLEAGSRLGPADHADGMTSLFPAAASGTLEFPIEATRTIAVGGTSRKWNGVVTRLLPGDFRVRTERGLDVDWPISYDDLADYYCQAERDLQVSGGTLISGAEPPRCPYPSETPTYTSPATVVGRPDLPFFPLAFALGPSGGALRLDEEPLRRLLASAHATLLDRHPVTALEFDRAGTVVAVEARLPDNSRRLLRARYIALAAGVVETVRLLLQSRQTSGVPLGGVALGLGFNGHPRYRAQVEPRADLPRLDRVHRTYLHNPASFRGRGAFIADFQLSSGRPLVEVTLELAADRGNALRLDNGQVDRWGRPVVALQADWTPRDVRTRVDALAAQDTFVSTLGTALSSPVLRWFHPAGACRMATDERSGAVDANLRVFATTNLFVAGASVFPTAGATNPTLTIVALSLRLADHLTALLSHRSS